MSKYIFHDTGSPKTINRPIGPYFTHWVDLIGNKVVYTREDIEKFAETLSDTLKQRVLRMRDGTCIRITSIGRYHYLALQKLTQDEQTQLDEYVRLKEALAEVNSDIKKACPQDLLLKKYSIEKQLKELKKGVGFDVI